MEKIKTITSVYSILKDKTSLYLFLSILISLFYSYQSYNKLSTFQELPSYLIGGDLYAQLGQIHYMNKTLDIIGNHYYQGKVFSYNPIYSLLVLPFIKILNIEAINAMKIVSSILIFMSIVWFLVILKISNNPLLALISHIFVLQFSVVILKYTEMVIPIIAPITIYLVYKKNYAWALLISLLSHNILFVTIGLFVIISIIYYKEYQRPIQLIDKNILPLSVLIILSFTIISRLDFELFPRLKIDFPDMSKIEAIDYIYLIYLPQYLINTLTIIFLVSYVYLLYKNRNLNAVDIWILIISLLIILAPLTDKLFGINMLPNYTINLVITPALIFGVALRYDKSIKSWMLLLILIPIVLNSYNAFYSRFEILKNYNNSIYNISEIKNVIDIINSDPGVVLSNKPLSFLINAYTGTNVVTSRWAQSFHLPFMNLSNRDLDAAIMLYSNNSELRKTLLEKYNVKYILFDIGLFLITEYKIDNNLIQKIYKGESLNSREYPIFIVDPLMCIGCEDILKVNNIDYITADAYLDPSIRENYIRTFKVALIDFRNYNKFEAPPGYDLIYANNSIRLYKKID